MIPVWESYRSDTCLIPIEPAYRPRYNGNFVSNNLVFGLGIVSFSGYIQQRVEWKGVEGIPEQDGELFYT